MKKSIFSTWLKEFGTLVFIQTIQAFIFAVIMVLIISVMTPENVAGIDSGETIAATGFIAVIALASISKIEDLVKKIFKIESSVTDPSMKGGLKSLATTMMAAKLAKGVADNAGKITGGIGGAIGASRGINKAKTKLARNLRTTGVIGSGASGGGSAGSGTGNGDNGDGSGGVGPGEGAGGGTGHGEGGSRRYWPWGSYRRRYWSYKHYWFWSWTIKKRYYESVR